MRGVRIYALGGPEELRYEDGLPDLSPGAGEAIVRIEAAGVNFIDVYQRSGLYPVGPVPCILGEEGGGTVEAVGEGVTEVSVGERVVYTSILGAYAERAVVPASRLVPLPAGVSVRQGAAVMLQGLTAHYLACSTYPLAPTDTCLVHAAAGGVGLLLCQIAKLRGARVLGTVSSEEKAYVAREAGADEVIIYTQQDFLSETRRLTGGRGVQVVYDGVGRTTFDGGLASLATRGAMVLFGQSSGTVAPIEPSMLGTRGSLFLTRPRLRHYIASREELLARSADLFGWIVEGRLKLRIDREWPLSDAREAHYALEGRKTMGKVLLIP